MPKQQSGLICPQAAERFADASEYGDAERVLAEVEQLETARAALPAQEGRQHALERPEA